MPPDTHAQARTCWHWVGARRLTGPSTPVVVDAAVPIAILNCFDYFLFKIYLVRSPVSRYRHRSRPVPRWRGRGCCGSSRRSSLSKWRSGSTPPVKSPFARFQHFLSDTFPLARGAAHLMPCISANVSGPSAGPVPSRWHCLLRQARAMILQCLCTIVSRHQIYRYSTRTLHCC